MHPSRKDFLATSSGDRHLQIVNLGVVTPVWLSLLDLWYISLSIATYHCRNSFKSDLLTEPPDLQIPRITISKTQNSENFLLDFANLLFPHGQRPNYSSYKSGILARVIILSSLTKNLTYLDVCFRSINQYITVASTSNYAFPPQIPKCFNRWYLSRCYLWSHPNASSGNTIYMAH